MNIDYAICNALKYNSWGLLKALVIYDIGCQWIIHFLKRLKESNHLSLPDVMKLIVAVGKFHLSAHVQECFVKYSLNFVRGSGQLDGEILETLWSPLNHISASARTMSMAARRQLIDDHMRDSNFKKMVGIGSCLFLCFQSCTWSLNNGKVATLKRKHEKAMEGIRETLNPYSGLTKALGEDKVKPWLKEEKKAMRNRGEDLRIYEIQINQGGCLIRYSCYGQC